MKHNGYKKYKNAITKVMGREFPSRHEAERYIVLWNLQLQGDIESLECQKRFMLIPAQYEPDTVDAKGKPKKGKLIEREIAYIADFCYYDVHLKRFVVEDAKGYRTPEYVMKRKMMLYFHGIKIKEV